MRSVDFVSNPDGTALNANRIYFPVPGRFRLTHALFAPVGATIGAFAYGAGPAGIVNFTNNTTNLLIPASQLCISTAVFDVTQPYSFVELVFNTGAAPLVVFHELTITTCSFTQS